MIAALLYEGYIYHLICGFLISALMGLVWRPFIVNGFLAGYLKEIIDFYDYGVFDAADMYITWIGALCAVIFVLVLYKKIKYFLEHPY